MKFRGKLLLGGKTATGIEVPPKVVEGLGSGKRVAVRVTINGYTYRSTVAPLGGKFMLPISAENRAGAGVAAGDAVEVELEVDSAPRTVSVPPDFQKLLARDAKAKQFFESLSYSQQSWYVLWIEGAKKEETRQKRLTEAVSRLRAGRKP
jgi:Bacteriocin-protection, YdeI or OmpD-Associated/Domain of unknown function (DUF1905)